MTSETIRLLDKIYCALTNEVAQWNDRDDKRELQARIALDKFLRILEAECPSFKPGLGEE